MGLYYPRCAAVLSVVFDGFSTDTSVGLGGHEVGNAAHGDGGDSRPTVIHLDGSPGNASAPRRATAHLNSYAKADSFDIEILAKALPVSPELIRAMAVELYMFQTDGLEADISKYLTDENLLVAGLADEGEIGGETVHFSGRDYTALMLDKAWPASKAVPAGRPVDQVVQDLVDEASQAKVTGRILTVDYRASTPKSTEGDDAKAGISRKSQISKRSKGRSRAKPNAGEASTKTNKKGLPQKGGSYWDVIQKLCLRHGLICYVHGTKVVIDDPRGLTVRTAENAPHLVWGRNLKDIKASRKFSRAALPQFVAYGYDDKQRKQVVGRWPPDKPQRPNGLGATLDSSEIITAPPGVTSAAALTEYCRAYYEARARAEGKLHFVSRSLRDIDGRDMIQSLRPGHPARIEWDHVQGSGELRRMGEEERYGRMLALGYSREVAQLVASGYERLEQVNDRELYVRDVSFDWSKDEGITVEAEAVNYVVEVRDDA
jgi:hypothetical protein